MLGLSLFSQQQSKVEKTPASSVKSETPKQEQTPNLRTSVSASHVQSSPAAPLPYDTEDKYMGRKAEFLNQMTVSELPADFPVYEKQWSLNDYNLVVEAYYRNHQGILKERVKQKLAMYPAK
jgi:hypothetical protein